MSTAQILEELGHLSDVERLEIIEVATRLVRSNITSGVSESGNDLDQRIRVAAAGVKDLYETGGELTEWTALDAEEFVDDNCQR